jgi:hypothetical protein
MLKLSAKNKIYLGGMALKNKQNNDKKKCFNNVVFNNEQACTFS